MGQNMVNYINAQNVIWLPENKHIPEYPKNVHLRKIILTVFGQQRKYFLDNREILFVYILKEETSLNIHYFLYMKFFSRFKFF